MSNSVALEGSARTQFGLKSLFVLMTAVAVVLAPTYWFGAGYLFPALFSIALVSLCASAYARDSKPVAFIFAVMGLIAGFLFAMVSMVFFAHALLNMVICVVVMAAHARPRVFTVAMAGVMAAVYGFAIYVGAGELNEVRAAKARYPFETVEPRLAFEKGKGADASASKNPIQLTSAVSNHLDEQDELQDEGRYSRQWALRQLHEQTYRDFIFAPGFGVSRMPRFRPQMVELEPRRDLVLPWTIDVSSLIANQSDMYDVHQRAVSDFISPDRIGYVRSRTEVAGFNAHAFENLDNKPPTNSYESKKLQVARLELVSLLRHAEPRVYVAATMPSMDQLASVPHRALNEFEQRALPSLKSQEDVVVDQHRERIEMLGAVRAGATCLECHSVERGALLGAFSYEITPVPTMEKTTAAIK